MKRVLLLPVVLVGCIDDKPVTVDEVITSVTIDPEANAARVADGVTTVPVEVCVIAAPGRDPSLSAVLRTSAGKWLITDASDSRSVTVKMTSDCEKRDLVPSTDAGSVSVTATVNDFSKSTTATLVAAEVMQVRMGAMGTLSSSASSMVVVTATLDVETRGALGSPTKGTEVDFAAAVEPAGAIGYFSDPVVRVSDGSSVKTTYFASAAVTKVTFTAIAKPEARASKSSDPLVIQR